MRKTLRFIALAALAMIAGGALAGMPALPDGAQSHWTVSGPEEIVTYVMFDAAAVSDRLPPSWRFITVGELAAGGVGWATTYLAGHPADGARGVSFLEIVRAKVFDIDGRSPQWPEDGAVGLWCARVAARDSAADSGPGRPLLMLDAWLPEAAYVAYMREKGYYATAGDVRLQRDAGGTWRGTVDADGLTVSATCRPDGPVSGGPQSAGMQQFIPPRNSPVTDVVRVAFAGHRVQECAVGAKWSITGSHPLSTGVIEGATTFQSGYELAGGSYPAREAIAESDAAFTARVNAFVDEWHADAAHARLAYFDKIAPDGVYIGTDKTERWTRDAFKAWAARFFERPSAWSFTARHRNVAFTPDRSLVWFDEQLDSVMGVLQASGVMRARAADGEFEIVHYQLAIAVPNGVQSKVSELIKESEGQ